MSISTRFDNALRDALPATLQGVVTESTTVGALQQLISDHPELRALPLSVFGKTKSKQARPKSNGAGPTTFVVNELITRLDYQAPSRQTYNRYTVEGRAEFDAAVLAAINTLGGKDVASGKICELVGCDGSQARNALTRLCNEGTITWTGRARSTRYHLVS